MIGPWKRAVEAETKLSVMEGRLAEATQTVQHLSTLIAELKREGFASPPQNIVRDSEMDLLPEEVVEAMHVHADPGSEAWNRMGNVVRQLQRAGVDPHEIAERVEQGENFSWEV